MNHRHLECWAERVGPSYYLAGRWVVVGVGGIARFAAAVVAVAAVLATAMSPDSPSGQPVTDWGSAEFLRRSDIGLSHSVCLEFPVVEPHWDSCRWDEFRRGQFAGETFRRAVGRTEPIRPARFPILC